MIWPYLDDSITAAADDEEKAAMLCLYAQAVYDSRPSKLESDSEKYSEIMDFYNSITN